MEDSRITKINKVERRGNTAERETLSPGSIPALPIAHVVTAALRLLVECRAFLAYEPEVQHLPRGEAGRAIVKQSTVPGIAVEAIHLLLQAIEARILPRAGEFSVTRSRNQGFRRRHRIGVFSFQLDGDRSRNRRSWNRRNWRRMFGRSFCNILLMVFAGSRRDLHIFFRVYVGTRLFVLGVWFFKGQCCQGQRGRHGDIDLLCSFLRLSFHFYRCLLDRRRKGSQSRQEVEGGSLDLSCCIDMLWRVDGGILLGWAWKLIFLVCPIGLRRRINRNMVVRLQLTLENIFLASTRLRCHCCHRHCCHVIGFCRSFRRFFCI